MANFSLHDACISRIHRQKIIWHFCTPKSASTFLMNGLWQSASGIPTVARLRCVPVHQDRPQVLCAYTVAESIGERPFHHVMIGSHTHALATSDLLKMISDNHLVVVQTRPLLDTVVSMRDHLDKNAISPFITTSRWIWSDLSDEDKVDYIRNMYVPWHLEFLQGWDNAAADKNIQWVSYDEAINDTNRVLREILAFHSLKGQPLSGLPSGYNRINVGRSGRGDEKLSRKQKEKIADLVRLVSRNWQSEPASPHAALTL